MIADPSLVVAGLLAALSAGLLTRAVLRPSRRLAPRLTPYVQVSRVRLGRAPAAIASTTAQGAALGQVFGPAALAAAGRVGEMLGGTDDDIRRRLHQAGWGDTDPRRWRLRQAAQLTAWTVGLAAVGLVTGRSAGTVLVLAILGTFIGFGLTRGKLTSAIDVRRVRMRSELYTLAQLLAMLVRTGSSPLQAVNRVSRLGSGPVAGELSVAMSQIAGGTPEQAAFERLARATPEPAAARLYRLLASSTQLGGDLSAALRALADDLRTARSEAIERDATRKRGLMIVVTLLFLAPVMLIFIGVPIPSIIFSSR